jgi:carboxymethylenebutenolidase
VDERGLVFLKSLKAGMHNVFRLFSFKNLGYISDNISKNVLKPIFLKTMDQKIIDLYDEYTHMPLTREAFLKKLVKLTGSMALAMTVLPSLEGCYTAPKTAVDINDLFIERVTFPGVTGAADDMKAYVARPKADGRYPAVIVIHENRGLTPHIEDVTRRLAQAGYLAIAPDALSPFGGTPSNEDEARALISKLDPEQNLDNFINAVTYATERADSTRNVGAVGFCWGGAMANSLAVNVPALKAAVAYYGSQPEAKNVPRIKAAVQLHYAELDERINAGIPAYEEALKKAGVRYELYMYKGVNHAFHNDTSAARYDESAAKLSWERTLAFFEKYVK